MDVSVGIRLFHVSDVLTIAARTVGGLAHPDKIEDIERDLSEVIDDFDRAVSVETFRRSKRTGEHLFLTTICSHLLRVEQEPLLRRLHPVATNYHRDFGCADGTRKFLLNCLIDWSTKEPGQDKSNLYWIYGLPGIGKTAVSHSICASLHQRNRLAGAFFCRRGDENLKEPRNILPTLIHKLAVLLPPFRRVVVERLRNDPNLTPGTMDHNLLLELIRKLPSPPKRTLVFVIDAFDECGDSESRPDILKALTAAAAHVGWLKIILTSRLEVDIREAFAESSHEPYDLGADEETSSDIRTFAQIRFKGVASKRGLIPSWPEQLLFDRVISRAAGLFIYIETIARALEQSKNPTESLETALQDSASPRLTHLYGLYSSILKARIVHDTDKFRRVIGMLLVAARPLCEETIAELAEVRFNLVKKWVVELDSLLYRDEEAKGGIRVRHLSISEFFLSQDCPGDYHVDLQDANKELGIACLKNMIGHLRFNICDLEDSRLANKDVHDLPLRIEKNISDALQYSSLYWSDHLCFDTDKSGRRVWDSLSQFIDGPCGLYWIEVLSLMGMVPIGVPSLRRVLSTIVKVSTALILHSKKCLIRFRSSIRSLLKKLRTFAASSILFEARSLRAPHISISQRNHSCPLSPIYRQPCSANSSLKG